MHFFRMRLIYALIAGISVVSVASTYFEVLSYSRLLRHELESRVLQQAQTLSFQVQQIQDLPDQDTRNAAAERMRADGAALALAIFDANGQLNAAAGPPAILAAIPRNLAGKVIQKAAGRAAYGRTGDRRWLDEAVPLKSSGGQTQGVLVLVEDIGYIRSESNALWRTSFLRIAALVVLIAAITVLMVRWFLMRPMMRVAERLRLLRMGRAESLTHGDEPALELFSPIAREVETLAESLVAARAAAASEARLRDAGEQIWTAERLAVHVREQAGSSRIFVVSNREPYMHIRKGRETVCVVPPSGLVTAIEPVLRACDGVWVAHGSGSGDAAVVDEFDRLRVPPNDPRYSLRRIWLSSDEESGYYDGFANEGIWPLCHIAHTRPIFRSSDWERYQQVNQKFANALLEEMEASPNPIVFLQDYHLALLPRMIKSVRPEARVAIFWHIPWPNPEAFGICPWQDQLLEGLLGADLIGFHIPLHCNNFLSTVDRALEARTDREHMTARRNGHTTTVRPYPVSVSLESFHSERAGRPLRDDLLDRYGLRADTMLLGVDRLDYTKGIVERLAAVEHFLEQNPSSLGRVCMVQIAAPSRTRIPSYLDLRRRVQEAVERINNRFHSYQWRPVLLIERQVDHEEVENWYRAADMCLVTSLHDGMNLVAKEYVAARDDDDGVLVLSKFTGAAIELRDALLVNPYDTEGVADAISFGLEMDRDERRVRMQRMRRYVMEHNVYGWAAKILGDLRELRLENQGIVEVGRARPTIVSTRGSDARKMA